MSCQHGEQIGTRHRYPATRARVVSKRTFIFRKPYRPAIRTLPTAREIADYLQSFPFLLGWRTKYLLPPICAGFGVGKATAMRGISLARSST